MEATAVDFVRYPVSDLERSVQFYRDELGLALEEHVEDFGWAEFAVPPTTLALDETESVDEPDGNAPAIAFAVDDVEAAVEDLRGEGVPVAMEPIETGVCDQAMVRDPDGNPVLLHRRDDGTEGRRDPFP